MATITIDRVLRTAHLTGSRENEEHGKRRTSIAARIKDWAETYAAYKIEKENWQRFDV